MAFLINQQFLWYILLHIIEDDAAGVMIFEHVCACLTHVNFLRLCLTEFWRVPESISRYPESFSNLKSNLFAVNVSAKLFKSKFPDVKYPISGAVRCWLQLPLLIGYCSKFPYDDAHIRMVFAFLLSLINPSFLIDLTRSHSWCSIVCLN